MGLHKNAYIKNQHHLSGSKHFILFLGLSKSSRSLSSHARNFCFPFVHKTDLALFFCMLDRKEEWKKKEELWCTMKKSEVKELLPIDVRYSRSWPSFEEHGRFRHEKHLDVKSSRMNEHWKLCDVGRSFGTNPLDSQPERSRMTWIIERSSKRTSANFGIFHNGLGSTGIWTWRRSDAFVW